MRHNYEDIGLFPLRLLLLPGEQTTLHIYEPRYLQLITECIDEYKLFGVPYQTKTSLSEFGSMLSVVQVLKKYDNGELDILVECTQNFKINQFQAKSETKLYPVGSVTVIHEEENMPSAELMDTMKGYLETLLDKAVTEELNEFFSFKHIIKSLNLNDEEKYRYLHYPLDRRNQFLKGKAKFMTLLIEQEKKVVDQFYLN